MTYRTRIAGRRTRRLCRWLLLMAGVLGCLAVASPAAAHLDLASTSPADGSTLKNPAGAIIVTFTKAATPSGRGFTLYDRRGRAVAIEADTDDDGVTWKIRPTHALEPGARYGLAWKVTAGDTHPRSGTVRFRVAAPSVAGQDATAPSDAPAHSGRSHAMPGTGGATSHAQDPDAGALDASLAAAQEERTFTDVAAGAARWMSFVGILVAVGGLIVVVSTLVGSDGDVRLAERVIRVAAALTVLGALVEGVCLLWTLGTSAPRSAATAVGLRLVAGLAMAAGLRLVSHVTGGRRAHDVPALPQNPGRRQSEAHDLPDAVLGGAVATSRRTAQLLLTPPVRTGRVRGLPVRPVAATVMCTAMLASFAFDGHTAAVGPRILIVTADLAHTAAAAVWVGGVVLLATLLLIRARAGVPTGAGELAVRFSVPASAAVVVAGLAGVALTLMIIDHPRALTGTAWGRVLLIKLALVAVVALMGYVNNRYALPALDAWRPGTARVLRRTVAAEAAVMIIVLLVTAVLVASRT